MQDHLTSGPARILSSGTATTFLAHPLSVSVQLVDQTWYRIDFRCAVDPQVQGPQVSTQAEPWGITLRLVNFEDGRGSAVPVLLGESGDQLYFLHFRVFRYGRTRDHTVHWTVFVAGKQDVDWDPDAGT